MNSVWIAVAVLAAFGFAVICCLMFAVAWYAIMQMRQMKAAGTEIVNSIAEFTGDGSITRLSKAVTSLSGELPEAVVTLKSFNKTMAELTKMMFVPDKPAAVPSAQVASAFYPYSEEQAAEAERASKASAEKMDISAEQFAAMRTEDQAMPEEKSLPPHPEHAKTA